MGKCKYSKASNPLLGDNCQVVMSFQGKEAEDFLVCVFFYIKLPAGDPDLQIFTEIFEYICDSMP
jgi:hypothetical protein